MKFDMIVRQNVNKGSNLTISYWKKTFKLNLLSITYTYTAMPVDR